MRCVVPFLLSAAVLAIPARACWARVGYDPRTIAAIELTLESPPRLQDEFRVTGRVKLLVPARGVTLELEPPQGVAVLEGGIAARKEAPAGTTVELASRLRVNRPLAGAPLRLVARFVEAEKLVADQRVQSKTVFLTVTDGEGGEGMPGDLWTRYLPAPAAGVEPGYLLAEFGPPSPGASAASSLFQLYSNALATLYAKDAGAAAQLFEGLTRSSDPAVALAARNGQAVALASRGNLSDADVLWQRALVTQGVTGRSAAYLEYNRGIARRAQGKRAEAADRFRAALSHYPGFAFARRALGVSGDASGAPRR